MKQIFDWLREHLEEMAQDVSPNTDKLVVLARVERLINEAEAKWEADCCEYEYHVAPSKDIYYLTSCKNRHNGRLWTHEPYCRYCGKPIKISKVE